MLGVSVGTSKSQLHRARMTLRGHLNEKVETADADD
jgi:DNA-directed RNA polymerase specialized sigma24 family protein